jgi:hypothetical protein
MFADRTNWPLAPNELSKLIEEFRSQGRPFLDLTESNPTHCGFTFNPDQIQKALADPRSLTYDPDPRGPLVARETVAQYYAERDASLSPQQIFLTASTSEAYSYAFRLLANAGDSVLVPHPSYPLFEFLAGLNDLTVVPYPLAYHDGWTIDIEAVKASARRWAGKVRAIVLVHPNNPTGSFVTQPELDALMGICKEHSLALVADEVFADYAFASRAGRVVTHAAEERTLTFTLSGLSKISALPQMKLGWVVVSGPGNLLQQALARMEVIADTYLSVSAPPAHALPKLLELRRQIQPRIRAQVAANLRTMDGQLTPSNPVSRLRCDGGWCAILRVPATRSDERWAVELLAREQVLVHPGHFYDFPSDGHLVVSLLPSPDVFQQGISRALSFISQQA